MKRFFYLLTSLTFMISLFGQEYRIVPNHGHLNALTVMAVDGKRNSLITLGKDNNCLVTDIKKSRVVNRFSYKGNLVNYVLNPQYPEFSLVTEIEGKYTLTAYNWQSGEVLFSLPQESIPFFLKYSQSGDILMYGNYTTKVRMIDHGNGSVLKGPDLISSLLTYGYMGGSAITFMGYNPSGQLIYYDRDSSQIKGNVSTISDLTDLDVLQNDIQLMTARRENTVYLINRQTGQESDSISFENIISYHCSPLEGTLTLLFEEKGEIKISLLAVRRNKFREEIRRSLDLEEQGVAASGYGKQIFLGTESGDILNVKSTGKASSLFPQKILKISELALENNRLITGNSKALWEWESPFFEEEGLEFNHILNLRRRNFIPPYDNIRLATYKGNGVLWSNNKRIREDFFLIQEKKDTLDLFYTLPVLEEKKDGFFNNRNEKQEGIALLSYLDNRELLFLWEKTCIINEITENTEGEYERKELYRYNHPSLETAAMISDELLIMGKNTYYGGNNAISIINVITGETLYMEDDREVITQIIPVDGKGHFYSLGYRKEGETNYAHVREHTIDGSLIISTEIYKYKEDITNQSRLFLSGEEETVLLKKGDDQWMKISKKGILEAEISSQSKILSHNGYIYLISPDHSLIIMDEKTLRPLAKVYIFENGQWLALSLMNNYYFYSKEARDLFSVYKLN
jgi:hypothetical protein